VVIEGALDELTGEKEGRAKNQRRTRSVSPTQEGGDLRTAVYPLKRDGGVSRHYQKGNLRAREKEGESLRKKRAMAVKGKWWKWPGIPSSRGGEVSVGVGARTTPVWGGGKRKSGEGGPNQCEKEKKRAVLPNEGKGQDQKK